MRGGTVSRRLLAGVLGVLAAVPALAQVQRTFVNLGFELPSAAPSNCYFQVSEALVPGWTTTHPSQNGVGCAPNVAQTPGPLIEIWRSGYNSVVARSGSQFAELNAEASSRIYQNVCLATGEPIGWRFSHRGRQSATVNDVTEFRIGSSAGTNRVVRAATQNDGDGAVNTCYGTSTADGGVSGNSCNHAAASNGWRDYSGQFTWLGSTAVHAIGFESISTGGGSATIGNFIDDIQVTLRPFVELSSATATVREGEATPALPTLRVVGTVPSGGITVQLAVQGASTATRGSDFSTASGTDTLSVTVPAGVYDGNDFPLPLSLIDDAAIENGETLVLAITSSPSDYVLSSTQTCGAAAILSTTIALGDNDLDLATALSATPASARGGDTVTLDWTVRNNTAKPTVGSALLHDATSTLALTPPSGLSFASWTCTASGGASCPGGAVDGTTSGSGAISGAASLPAGNAAAGGQLSYAITAAIAPTHCSNLTQNASLTTPAGLGEGSSVQSGFTSPASGGSANNSASAALAIHCEAPLSLSKDDGSTIYAPGGGGTYTLILSNAGPSTATGVTLTDTLPTGATLSAAATCTAQGSASCGTLSGAGGASSVSLSGATVPAGLANRLQLTIPVSYAATLTAATLTNTATADAAVSDPVSASDTNTRYNRAPVADAQSLSLEQGGSAAVTLSGSDADNDTLSFRVTTPPQHGSLSGTPPALTYTPASTFSGSDSFAYVANDSLLDSTPATVSITVTAANRAPTVTSTAITTATAGSAYRYDVEATDPDNDTLTYSLLNPPSGVSIDSSTGVISWTPTTQQVGSHTFAVRVSDGHGGTGAQDFTLTVSSANHAPEITSTAITSASVGTPYSYDVDATDADNDTLTYTLSNPPGGMSIDTATGAISWTPAANQAGPHSVTVQVSDGHGGSDEQSFSIDVGAANRPPAFTSTAPTQATRGEAWRYDAQASDPDGDVLAYDLDEAPAGMTVDAASGRLDWIPGDEQVGTHAVSLRVSDGRGGSAVQDFSVTVIAVNRPPRITSTPVVAGVAGTAYRYDVNATDPDNDALTYRLVDFPAGMSINATTGVIDWLPTDDQLAAADVTVQVQDAHGASDDQVFRVIVNADLVGHSHVGREFWFTHSLNSCDSNDLLACTPPHFPARSHWVTVAALNGAQGFVEIPGLNFRQDFTIAAGGIAEIQLPWQVMNSQPAVARNLGVHVVSDEPVTVVALNRLLQSTDAAVIYPVDVLGLQYTAIDYPRYTLAGGQISVVAIHDNTTVSFTPPPGKAVMGPGGVVRNSWSVTLQRGQAYQLYSWEGQGGEPYSGARVISSRQVAVFGGGICANVPVEAKACDHLFEQLLPDRNLGQRFLAGRLATRSVGNVYRFVATEDDTAVYAGTQLVAVLRRGDVAERLLDGPVAIYATKPVQAWLLAAGETLDSGARDVPPDVPPHENDPDGNLLDPFAIGLPPVGTELSDYLFTTPQVPALLLHYAGLTIPESAVASLRLDGAAVSGVTWQPIPGTSSVHGNLRLAPGRHRLTAAAPFGLIVYGYGPYESYGYTGGLLIGNQDRVQRLEVTPLAQTRTVGDSACFAVVARDEQNKRIPYARFGVRVDGRLARAESGYLDGTGRGEYCFEHPFAEITPLVFESGFAQIQAQVEWLAPTDGVNRAPIITSLPALELRDAAFHYDLDAVDPNGDVLNYVLVSGPSGAQIDAQTGVLAWTPPVPANREPLLQDFTLRAVDPQGLHAEQRFTLQVHFTAQLSVVSKVNPDGSVSDNQSATEGFPYTSGLRALGGVAALLRVDLLQAPLAMTAELFDRQGSLKWSHDAVLSPALRYNDALHQGTRDYRSTAPDLVLAPVWRNSGSGMLVPVFGRPLDTNNDGVVNASDRLVAAAVAGSRLVARFVDTGEALPWSGTPQAYANIVPAFVDLDGDGRDELLYCNSASKLVAINGANQRIWNTDPVFGTNSFYPLFTSIEAADLDGDGTPEIFAAGRLYGANGVSRWNMGPSSGYVNTAYVSPLLIDIDGDGVREVLFYNEVRRANGSLAWTVPALSPSSPAVAEFAAFDFDGDGDKEVIASVLYTASNERRLERFNHDGTRLGNPIPLVSAGGPPAIFDIDRDGTADIYLPLERKAWSLDGSVRSALEPLSSANLPLLFDANGDGAVESLGPVDSSGDRFIRDVQTDWSWSQLKLGLTEQRGPGALVDSDGDGNAEWFVAGADNALARPVHGVWPADRAGRRSYRDGVARHAGSFDVDIPPRTPDDLRYDLWIGDLRQRAGGDAAHKRYEVNVRNRGLRGLQQPVTVRLYAGERGNGGHELTHKTIAPLRSGERAAAVFDDVRMDDLQGWIFAYVDAAANENGSDFLPYNNRVAAHVIDIVLSDGNSRVDRLLHSVEVRQRSLDLNINGNLPANVYSGHTITLQLLADQIDLDGSPYFFLTGAPEGARIDPWTGVLTWTPTAAQAGYRYFYANVRFPSGVHDIVMLTTTVVANPNRPPQITSTAPKYAVVGQAWNYAVAASDPDGDALTYALNPAAAGMSIDAQTGVISWTPATAGTQSATVRVTDSANNTTAQAFSVTVQTPATSIPVFSTSPPTTAKAGCLYTYDAEAANAGGQVMTYELFAGAPAGMTVNGATGLVQWTPAADQAGIRRVTVHVHNPGSTAFANQTWDIDVAGADRALRVDGLASPTYAAPNQPIALEAVVQYAAGSYMLTATVNGAPLALDAQGKASFTPPAAGAYTVVFNVADGCQSAQSSVTFYAGDATDTDPPLVQLHTPSNDSVITKPTAIVGTVNDAQLARWRLALKDSAGADQHRILATGTNTFSNAAFATLDPTLLMNGIHILVLEGTDTSGRVTTDSVAVSVEGDMKVGHYSVTFLELEIPLNGIPIRVTRTYDTRRAHEDLDFGYGWSIDYQNVRLRENRKLGYSWLLAQQSGGLAPWCVRPLSDPLVTVTLPDGKVEKFKARFEPECQQYTPTVYGELKFSPVGDTHSELKQLSYGTVRVVEQGESSNLVDLDALDQPLDPALYELTTEEGMVYVIDQQFGIRTITDQAGNTITYSRDGIIHSSGRRIGFERDAQDRIVRITQPDGEARTYTYSPAGDLLTAADPLGDASRYGYLASPRWPHYLETIHDPRNTRVARYEYDADGRLVASVDANDKRIEYTHDIAGQVEQVKNRRGHTTTYVYDDNGWVLSETNALNEQTLHTYDTNGNELTTTDPLNRTTTRTFDARGNVLTETNPAGETVTRTYGRYNQLKTETDAQNRVVLTNHYWKKNGVEETGFLTSSVDALGNTTVYALDLCAGLTCGNTGNLKTLIDANGKRRSFEYDRYGNLTQETDTRNNTTLREYDTMGRVLKETRRRLINGQVEELVTVNEYDAAGNAVKTVAPDGVITTRYYEKGQLLYEQTGLQRRDYTYTPDGRLESTIFNGNLSVKESTVYDAEGNVIEQRDVFGSKTRMVYDAANRLIETIHPDDTGGDTDNARSRQEYDKAGQLKTSWDERNQPTTYTYDDAGRQVTVKNALDQVMTSEYDGTGRRALSRDPLGRETRYVYDLAGRLTRTILPDPVAEDADPDNNPVIDYVYDKLGRKVAQTDIAAPLSGIPARTTRYVYDAESRLIGVVLPNPQTDENPVGIADALGRGEYPAATIASSGVLVTRYGYDEQGNKISQTDALNRTTTWAYDKAGRVIRRTLPLGQSEETRYDANGRIDWQTDFNGQLTRYVHDSDNRVTNVFYADGTELVLTYDKQSRPLTLSHGGITETRRYDLRGRMDQVKWSDGQQIDYSYDAAGNRTSVVTGTRTINFGFDTLNRLSSVSEVASAALGQSGAVKVTTYGYDGVGNRDHVIHNNGTRVDYRYDRMNRLTKLVHSKGAAVLLALGYTLNPDGTRAQIAEQVQQRDAQGQYVVDGQGQPVLDATRTTSYDYDATKRLVEEAVTSATPGYDRLTTWTYDSVGNRLNQLMTIPGGSLPGGATVLASTTTTSYRYDANDRLLDETAVSNGMTRLTTHRYDLNGSLVETIAPDATTRYRYDGRNKLAQVERQVGSVLDITQYTYTHDGIRRSQIQKAGTLDAKEVRYLIDPNQAYAQVIEERVGAPLAPGANVSGLSLKAAYTYGDDLLGQYALREMQGNLLPNVGAPSGTPNPVAVASTFHYDGLGSTRLLTDAAGSPVDRYAYHAFGERDEWTSELAAGQNPATDYQYTGEQFDPNLGLYYLRARYVDPGNGRFTQHDTFAGFSGDPVTLHKYAYANNNPSMLVDPSGYFSLVEASTVNNIIGHLSEFNVSSGFDLGNKLANPGSDLPSFEGWSMLASMIPFGTGARWLTRGLKEVKYGAGVVRYSAKHPPSEKEIAAAALIAEKNGAKIFLRGDGVKGADALIDGIKWEIKTLRAGTNNAVAGNIKWSVKRQSSRVVIDGRVAGLTEDAARAGIARAARDGYSATELMVLLPGDKILCF